MKILDVKQNTIEWFNARIGVATASEFDALISPEFKVRTGQMPRTYVAKKLAEYWRGQPLPGWESGPAEQGSIREDEALPWYSFTYGVDVQRPGFILSDCGRYGCSPDGLLPDGGLEIKCPNPDTHVKWLLEGGLPNEHVAQVHGSLFVTGLPQWTFLSYCRRLPPLVVTIHRSEAIMAKFADALAGFVEAFDDGYKKLVAMNDGRQRPGNGKIISPDCNWYGTPLNE